MLSKLYKVKYLHSLLEFFWGTLEARYLHSQYVKSAGSIQKGLENVLIRWGDKLNNYSSHVAEGHCPIFIFSAGWRSGSTLVQRLVFSSGKYFIWGEPYGGAGIIEHLAEQFAAFSQIWPVEKNFLSSFFREKKNLNNICYEWIANLTPDIQYFVQSHRKFLETLFYDPIKEYFTQWGLKEVRLGYEHALYLYFLYPRARFVFLVRNPIEAYRSYKRFRRWYVQMPFKPVFTPFSFAKHWNKLANDFLLAKEKIGAFLLKYEDLVYQPDKVFSGLQNYLAINMKRDLLTKKVGSSNPNRIKLNFLEVVVIKYICRQSASKIGYNL